VRTVGALIQLLLWLFLITLIVRLVFDYVFMFARSWQPRGPVVLLLEAVYSVTDPPLKALRRVIPPLRLGGISFDLAFIVLIVLVQVASFLVGVVVARVA
jgi:YggT family protein